VILRAGTADPSSSPAQPATAALPAGMHRLRCQAGIDVILPPEARVEENTPGGLSAVPAYA